MTRKQLNDSTYYIGAKSQTFYKGDEFYEVMRWLMEHIETIDVGKQGCQITKKYSISVKILNEDRKNYKPKRR